MHVKIQNSGKGGNSGSCGGYVNYLEKENENKLEHEKENFFSHDRDNVKGFEVIESIDNNRKKLGKDEAKFYSVTLSPSQDELKHIGNDKEKIKDFTRAVMDDYAKNFNRGIEGKDLVYYAKIEQDRTYKGKDKEVKQNKVKQKTPKDGLQTHVHVIVSRKDKTQKLKLSPLSNTRNKKVMFQGKEIQKGFDRSKFCNKVEQTFDKETSYNRAIEDTFAYKLEQKNLSTEEKIQQLINPVEKGQELRVEEEPLKEKDEQQKRDFGLDLESPM